VNHLYSRESSLDGRTLNRFYVLYSLRAVMKNIFCYTNNNNFSAQKPILLEKQPNVICLKLNFEQKTQKTLKNPKHPINRVFLVFSNPALK
jgi:hypothetical protein